MPRETTIATLIENMAHALRTDPYYSMQIANNAHSILDRKAAKAQRKADEKLSVSA
jgi:hypothetical protein